MELLVESLQLVPVLRLLCGHAVELVEGLLDPLKLGPIPPPRGPAGRRNLEHLAHREQLVDAEPLVNDGAAQVFTQGGPGDEHALAVANLEMAPSLERFERFAQGGAGDAQQAGEFPLRGEPVTRLQILALDHTDDLRGLLAEVECKNGWQLAEQAGSAPPRGIQRALDRYAWDADAVRDGLRAYVLAALGAPRAVLGVDETGFPKQGPHSAGVARQDGGPLGRRANRQVGVFLGSASPRGHVGLDRALYLPQEWTADRARCREAGSPDDVPFRTQPQRALGLVERALAAGVPAAWVMAAAVYGSASKFRGPREARGQASGLAVRGSQPVSTWPPHGPPAQGPGADRAAAVPATGWRRLSCGEGAQGPRQHDWADLPVRPALRDGWAHAGLVRRHPERPEELAFSLVYAPTETP